MIKQPSIKRTAFTLVELVVVLLILSILTSVAALNYIRISGAYREEIAKTNLKVLKSAVNVYRLNNNSQFPQKILSDVGHNNGIDPYLDKQFVELIKDPEEAYKYTLRNETNRLVLSVSGPNSFTDEIVLIK